MTDNTATLHLAQRLREYFTYDGPKWLRGHINIGKRITIFGANAMHYFLQIRSKRYGVICIRFLSLDKKFPLCFYVSPNGTPWACTYCIGLGPAEKVRSIVRRVNFGHNFDAWNDDKLKKQLWKLNDELDYLTKYKYALSR